LLEYFLGEHYSSESWIMIRIYHIIAIDNQEGSKKVFLLSRK
jgi:hypothetical protein